MLNPLEAVNKMVREHYPDALPGHLSTAEIVQRLIDYYTDEIDGLVRENLMLRKNIAALESQNAYLKRHSNFDGDEIFSIPT